MISQPIESCFILLCSRDSLHGINRLAPCVMGDGGVINISRDLACQPSITLTRLITKLSARMAQGLPGFAAGTERVIQHLAFLILMAVFRRSVPGDHIAGRMRLRHRLSDGNSAVGGRYLISSFQRQHTMCDCIVLPSCLRKSLSSAVARARDNPLWNKPISSVCVGRWNDLSVLFLDFALPVIVTALSIFKLPLTVRRPLCVMAGQQFGSGTGSRISTREWTPDREPRIAAVLLLLPHLQVGISARKRSSFCARLPSSHTPYGC